jgi:hypothetical protein
MFRFDLRSCLPPKKSILRTVTEDGGYGKCDVSDAFDRFIERVGVHRGKQREDVDEEMDVYFERNPLLTLPPEQE